MATGIFGESGDQASKGGILAQGFQLLALLDPHLSQALAQYFPDIGGGLDGCHGGCLVRDSVRLKTQIPGRIKP